MGPGTQVYLYVHIMKLRTKGLFYPGRSFFVVILILVNMSSESIKADNDTLSNKFRGHDKTEAATMMTPKEAKQKMEKESQEAKNNIARIPIPPLKGALTHYKDFPSKLIRPRPVDVWLPEGYDASSNKRYPVIYMHDGQMIFHHADSSLAGMDVFWNPDKVMTRLVNNNEVRPAIIVSIWMADWTEGDRGLELMPQKAVTDEVWRNMQEQSSKWRAKSGVGALSSDKYLKFIVTELKPFVDGTYLTLMDQPNTFIMGSSMGGLISAYAIAEYPDVFGAAACLSTDWTQGDGAVARWFSDHWPEPGRNRIYYDYGTEGFEAYYEPFQLQMNEVLRGKGFIEGNDFMTQRFDGADHSPKSWNARLHVPLKFLLRNN